METGSQNQVLGKLGLHYPLLDQLLEDTEIWVYIILGVALVSCGPVLKGGDLSLELLVKQLQFFLFAKDVIVVENHMLLLAI